MRDELRLDVLPADLPWPPSSSPTQHYAFRPLRIIDNIVTFRSSMPIQGESRWVVYKNGAVVHSETTELHLHSSSCAPGQTYSADMQVQCLYTTRLVPQYWHNLCKAIGKASAPFQTASSSFMPLATCRHQLVSHHAGHCRACARSSGWLGDESAFRREDHVLGHLLLQHPARLPAFVTDIVQRRRIQLHHRIERKHYFEPHICTFTEAFAQLDRVNDYDGLLDASMSNAAASSSSTAHATSQQYARYPMGPTSSQASFDMSPPGLIRDGEEGYASQPQSPLDAVFPGALAMGAALGAGTDPLGGMCKGYADVDFTGSAGCHFDGVGVPAGLAGAGAAAAYAPRLSDSLAHPGHQPYVSFLLLCRDVPSSADVMLSVSRQATF